MRLIFLFLFSFGITFLVSGQDVERLVLKGKVTGSDGAALAGASVVITGTNTGVITGPNGTYSIGDLAKGSYSIRFSFVGYEPQQQVVKLESDTILDIVLEEKVLMTDDVIIKATRAGEHAPLAYFNISREAIMKQNTGQDLPFLLSLTPSLVETSEAGNGVGYTSFRIRGTDASRINVTIDGIPLNDAESQQVFWVDLPDLASSVDNIQVQRGVGTSTNGAGAFGASVNIQTKSIEAKPFAEVNSSAGSYSTFKNSLALGTGLLYNKFAFQMRYSDIRSDGFIERTGSEAQFCFFERNLQD